MAPEDSQAKSTARRTWRRRAEARPDEILTAALDEFIASGFDAARMEDIAARAGVTKGSIYLYFEGKEALLRALIEREVSPVAERLEAAADSGFDDPAATLRMLAAIITGVIGNSRIFAIPLLVVSISNRFPDLAQHYRERVVARGRAALERLFKRGVELGQFRAIDPAAAARAMMGPIMFEMVWTHALKGPSARDSSWLTSHFDILLNGISQTGTTEAKP